MDNLDTTQQELEGQKLLREMERKSQDIIRVYNPLEETFELKYDGYIHAFPGQSYSDYPRYLCIRFMMQIIDKIMIRDADMAIKKENEERVKKGQKPMSYHEEQPVFEAPLLQNPEKRKKLANDVWVGIVRSYGSRDVTQESADTRKRREYEEKILEGLENKVAEDMPGVVNQKEAAQIETDELLSGLEDK